MSTATTAKPVITIKDIKVAGITIESKTSCHCFRAANGHTWYLKGSTLEVTTTQTANANYVPYPKERLATGRCGKIIGTIKKVNTNDDLTANLKILAALPKIEKAAKAPAVATPAAKTPPAKKLTAKKTTKKTTAKAVQVADTAPVQVEDAPAAKVA